MLGIFDYNPNSRTIEGQTKVTKTHQFLWYALILALTAFLAKVMLGATYVVYSAEGQMWDHSKIAWLLYYIFVIAIFIQPRYGVYMTVALALAGDYTITYWFPFELNFSSEQSLLYFNDSMKLSPLETFLLFTFVSYGARLIISNKWAIREKVYFGPLFLPGLLFTGFIAFGFLYGVSQGGDRQVALWEVRPIMYLFPVLFLASNLIEKRSHVVSFMWCIIAAMVFEGVFGWYVIFVKRHGVITGGGYQGLGAHSAAIHINTIFVFLVASFIYRVNWGKRLFLVSIVPLLGLLYIAMQRRAAFLTLAIGLVLLGVALFKYHRTLFYFLAPTAAVIGLLYIGAFWNSGSSLGMPAQAVKSVISPNANEADVSSNEYRMIENINSHFTINERPLTGVGFGQKFYIIAPMPDISFFEWWEYIIHNSIVWIWMKAGVGGFGSMIYLVSASLLMGARIIWRMPPTEVGAVAITMTVYIFMHFMFAYVDMSWEPQSMVYIGAAMGILNALERIMNKPVKLEQKRWPWSSEPEPVPQLEAA